MFHRNQYLLEQGHQCSSQYPYERPALRVTTLRKALSIPSAIYNFLSPDAIFQSEAVLYGDTVDIPPHQVTRQHTWNAN